MRLSIWSALIAVFALVPTFAAADPLPRGFIPYVLNASQPPVTEDDITSFRVLPGECSDEDYGDGRGENDCLNGNTKSVIEYTKDARLGQTIEYKFDFLVEPGFGYKGEFIREAIPFRGHGQDSRLRIASWEGPFIKNFIYMLKLDATEGSTFFGRVCQPADKFGSWASFSMKIRWANDQKGWIKVTCDDKIIYADEVVPTNAQIQCYTQNECQPGTVKDPSSFTFLLGLALNGFGHDWKESGFPSAFPDLPAEGLALKMRNIAVIEGAELYDADERTLAKTLQEALNSIGCDVGTADGVVGPKTRQQALICREFGEGEMPVKLTVANVGQFVSLYTRPGVADLPPGKVPVAPDSVTVFETKDDTRSPNEPVYFFASRVVRPDREVLEVDFLLIGTYDRSAGTFRKLELLLDHDITDAATKLRACGGKRIDDWGDAGKRLALMLARKGNKFETIDVGCTLEAIPEEAADKLAYLVDHFSAFAQALVQQGDVMPITNEDVHSFIEKVALGEITLGRPASDG